MRISLLKSEWDEEVSGSAIIGMPLHNRETGKTAVLIAGRATDEEISSLVRQGFTERIGLVGFTEDIQLKAAAHPDFVPEMQTAALQFLQYVQQCWFRYRAEILELQKMYSGHAQA